MQAANSAELCHPSSFSTASAVFTRQLNIKASVKESIKSKNKTIYQSKKMIIKYSKMRKTEGSAPRFSMDKKMNEE